MCSFSQSSMESMSSAVSSASRIPRVAVVCDPVEPADFLEQPHDVCAQPLEPAWVKRRGGEVHGSLDYAQSGGRPVDQHQEARASVPEVREVPGLVFTSRAYGLCESRNGVPKRGGNSREAEPGTSRTSRTRDPDPVRAERPVRAGRGGHCRGSLSAGNPTLARAGGGTCLLAGRPGDDLGPVSKARRLRRPPRFPATAGGSAAG